MGTVYPQPSPSHATRDESESVSREPQRGQNGASGDHRRREEGGADGDAEEDAGMVVGVGMGWDNGVKFRLFFAPPRKGQVQ